MSTGTHVPQFIGFVVALAIRELLLRCLRLAKGRSPNVTYALPWIWSMNVLLFVIQFWWSTSRTDFANLSFYSFVLLFLNPVIILAACVYVLPEEPTDLKAYFAKHSRTFLIICALAVAYAAPVNHLVDGEPWDSRQNTFRVFAAVWILIAAALTRKERFQQLTSVALFMLLLVYISLFSIASPAGDG